MSEEITKDVINYFMGKTIHLKPEDKLSVLNSVFISVFSSFVVTWVNEEDHRVWVTQMSSFIKKTTLKQIGSNKKAKEYLERHIKQKEGESSE